MKCRLREPTLPQPKITFAGQQTFAEKPAAVANDAIFLEIGRIADEHGFNQVRVVKEINPQPGSAVVENIPKFLRPLQENRKRIATGEWQVSDQEMWFGTGWLRNHYAFSVSRRVIAVVDLLRPIVSCS